MSNKTLHPNLAIELLKVAIEFEEPFTREDIFDILKKSVPELRSKDVLVNRVTCLVEMMMLGPTGEVRQIKRGQRAPLLRALPLAYSYLVDAEHVSSL